MMLQCSVSECRFEAVCTVSISFKETRNLCKVHYEIFQNRDKRHPPVFIRASKLQ